MNWKLKGTYYTESDKGHKVAAFYNGHEFVFKAFSPKGDSLGIRNSASEAKKLCK